ncbi:unnamed protein product [Brassicogethes aeneus]|uniref:Kinectin n=1 Tax=Brassicogethes aeneus TaxID=1431903 RepID=A0A9P0AWN7_BRAAE|nr:unnamed protein product [Brassicogethes aeneus]
MDISTPIIFIGIFIIACVSLFLVFKFGIKEKSYEEAVAEQRQQTNALLGVRAKPKEKKSKKSSKKPKDKSSLENDGDEIVETTNTKHVGFKEKPEILNLPKEPSPVKKEEIKEKVTKQEKKSVNLESEPIKAKKEKVKQPAPVTEKIETAAVKHIVEKKEKAVVEKIEEKKIEKTEVTPVAAPTLTVNTAKEKKKKKSEFNTLQQIKKEKLLTEAIEAQTALQTRIREIRGEVQAEKTQQNHKIKSLEELLNTKNIEVESGNNRNQTLQHQLQQLQAKFNDDLQKLVEENNGLVHQKQQLEGRLTQGQDAESMLLQLRSDLQNAQMELHRLNCDLQEVARDRQNFQVESDQVKNINKQLEETRQGLESQITILTKKEEEHKKEMSHLTTNLHQQVEENRKHEHTILQLRNEIKQLKAEKIDINNIIVQTELQTTLAQLDKTNDKNKTLLIKIEEQKAKNNDLRQKNWKVMEALNVAESRTKTVSSSPKQTSVDVLTKEIRLKEQDSQKQFIQRLFPEIEELKSISAKENWQSEFEKLITKHLESIKTVKETTKDATEENLLKMQVANYKSIIDETQQTKLEYETKLEQEKQRNDTLSKQCQQLNRVPSGDTTATIEKLNEEVNRLSELLRLEQTSKNGNLNGSPKEQNYKSTNGIAVIEGTGH